jgi:AcrR family transcriptional regulator
MANTEPFNRPGSGAETARPGILPRQPSSERTTRERILEAAVTTINESGEEALRVVEVASMAGVTQGMVTYHFRTRSQLVTEAHLRRYGDSMADDVSIAAAGMDNVETREELQQLVRALTAGLLDPARNPARLARAGVIAYSVNAPDLAEHLRHAHTTLIDELSLVMTKAQSAGLVRTDLAPRAIATMVAAYSFGLVLTDLDDHAPSTDEVAEVINSMVFSIFQD